MYGIAGHKYTPGMPKLSALDVKPNKHKTLEPKRKPQIKEARRGRKEK
jgi:hypothetical protein